MSRPIRLLRRFGSASQSPSKPRETETSRCVLRFHYRVEGPQAVVEVVVVLIHGPNLYDEVKRAIRGVLGDTLSETTTSLGEYVFSTTVDPIVGGVRHLAERVASQLASNYETTIEGDHLIVTSEESPIDESGALANQMQIMKLLQSDDASRKYANDNAMRLRAFMDIYNYIHFLCPASVIELVDIEAQYTALHERHKHYVAQFTENGIQPQSLFEEDPAYPRVTMQRLVDAHLDGLVPVLLERGYEGKDLIKKLRLSQHSHYVQKHSSFRSNERYDELMTAILLMYQRHLLQRFPERTG